MYACWLAEAIVHPDWLVCLPEKPKIQGKLQAANMRVGAVL